MTIPFLDRINTDDFLDFLDNLFIDDLAILDEQIEQAIKERLNEEDFTTD